MTNYLNVTHRETLDGGYSGEVTVTTTPGAVKAPMIFVEAELVTKRLMLTPDQALELAAALRRAADDHPREGQHGVVDTPNPTRSY